MTTPDVTVCVAVYNTMPYLRACLDSLVAQTLDDGRLEVVAIDDGSTDESGAVLDEYAAAHPTLFRVEHHPNSGGPAVPSNRALELATGRYVFFLGADDYLGPEALERMVAFADQHESDVVAGHMVGVNDRPVHQGLFEDGNQVDVDPFGPRLRWAIANTKLFRRSLVEGLGLRYMEDMPFGSDQPFTLTACLRGRRVSVLADYPCYYAVQREDRSNISFQTPYVERVACIRTMMQSVADLVPDLTQRGVLLVRHFTWEIQRVLRADLFDLPEEERREVLEAVRAISRDFLTNAILEEVPLLPRLRLLAVVHDDMDLLGQLVADGVRPGRLHLVAGRALAEVPGFRTSGLSDAAFRMAADAVSGRLSALARLRDVGVEDGALRVVAVLPLVGAEPGSLSAVLVPDPDSAGAAGTAGAAEQVDPAPPAQPELPARCRLEQLDGRTRVHLDLDLEQVQRQGAGSWRLVLRGDLEDGAVEVRLPGPADEVVAVLARSAAPVRVRIGRAAESRAMTVSLERLSPGEVASAAARRVRGLLRRT